MTWTFPHVCEWFRSETNATPESIVKDRCFRRLTRWRAVLGGRLRTGPLAGRHGALHVAFADSNEKRSLPQSRTTDDQISVIPHPVRRSEFNSSEAG